MSSVQVQAGEYWKWNEYRWTSPSVQPKSDSVVAVGTDIGSVSSKTAVVVDGQLFAIAIMRTGADSTATSIKVVDWALEGTGIAKEKINFAVGTGYGRVNIPYANKSVTEIACHARGANFIWGPSVKTILDMGGQDCKAIKCDSRGKVETFLMNDKCAAGTGRGLEVIADLLAVPITELGQMSLKVEEEPQPVSSTCTVFAKSETLGLIRAGWPKSKVLAAYCLAMSDRVATLLKKVGVEKEFVITGGISKNPGIVKRVEQKIGLSSFPAPDGLDPQLAGAIGAAFFAKTLYEKGKGA